MPAVPSAPRSHPMPRAARALRMAWAAPCSALGAVLGALALAAGGSARRVDGTLEIALRNAQSRVPRALARCPFVAITFGHVIVGQSHEVLRAVRAHERVHVAQYERWGAAFLLAYPLASAIAWLRGECPYHGNAFERAACASPLDFPEP